eukprot:766940-Hanusia_phi.AAC.3
MVAIPDSIEWFQISAVRSVFEVIESLTKLTLPLGTHTGPLLCDISAKAFLKLCKLRAMNNNHFFHLYDHEKTMELQYLITFLSYAQEAFGHGLGTPGLLLSLRILYKQGSAKYCRAIKNNKLEAFLANPVVHVFPELSRWTMASMSVLSAPRTLRPWMWPVLDDPGFVRPHRMSFVVYAMSVDQQLLQV